MAEQVSKEQAENSVLMKIFKGDETYGLSADLLREVLSENMKDADVGAVIGARDRLVSKKFLTKRFELTDRGKKRCKRIGKRQG